MPNAPGFDWPQGNPLFEVQLRAVTEGLAGNGVRAPVDFEISPTANVREVDVGGGTAVYLGTEASASGTSLTVGVGDGTYDRWDTIYFDTAASTIGLRAGTPAAAPEPATLQGDELLLGVVYVPQGFDDVLPDGYVHNWRAQHQDAESTVVTDSDGDFQAGTVEGVVGELDDRVSKNAFPHDLGTNPGGYGAIVDAPVDGNAAAGTEQSYDLAIDGTPLARLYAESDGAGGIQNARAELSAARVSSAPSTASDVGRKQELDGKSDTSHRHDGQALGGTTPLTSVTTEQVVNDIANSNIQAAWDGLVVPIAEGLGAIDAIDPTATTTPVQDAIDAINGTGSGSQNGIILLPSKRITEAATLSGLGGKSLIGRGIGETIIEMTDLAADGLDVSGFNDAARAFMTDLNFDGSSYVDRTGGSAIHFSGANARHFNLGRVRFANWTDPVIHLDSFGPFTARWGQLSAFSYTGRFIHANGGGAHSIECGPILVRPEDDSIVLNVNNSGLEARFESIAQESQSDTTTMVRLSGSNHRIRINEIKHEKALSGASTVVDSGTGLSIYEYIVCQDAEYDEAIRFQSNFSNTYVGHIGRKGGATFNNGEVNISSSPNSSGQSVYWGHSDDVAVNYFDGSTADGYAAGLLCQEDMRFADPISKTQTATISAGGSATLSFADLTALSRPIQPSEFDVSVAGRGGLSDVGVTVDKVYYDESAGNWAVVLSETEGSASVDVRVQYQPLR
jgi:hypothetical protein